MTGRSAADFEADHDFEVEVLRIARMIYPGSTGGSTIVDRRERDAVLVGREVVVAIEATRSRKLDKAESDAKKLKQLTEELARRHQTKAIRGFFVTADEPTAEQRAGVKRYGGAFVTALSLATLRRELFDAATYLAAREDYPFGSARDPRTNSAKIDSEYINLDLLEYPEMKSQWTLKEIAEGLSQGSRFALTGDYGVGKSMTLREIWWSLRKAWFRDPTLRIPIHLNLRNHQGQEDPAEALHRHATRIGFSQSADLVRAWRSGQVILILDGYDEITFPGWTGRVGGLADVRRRNVALVRNFLAESENGTGILIAGRSHFFDAESEMERSLGLNAPWVHLSASDFNDKQINAYLKSTGLEATLPAWMPSRPLLIGYLASRGMLSADDVADVASPAIGWDLLLTRVCEREAQIDVGLDGSSIRRIVERLASRARRTTSGRGPLRFDDLSEAFREVCGYQPDEGSRVILDRLPGLGVGLAVEDDSADLPREFLDEDLADTARSGDVYAFATSPNHPGIAGTDLRDWDFLLEELGIDVVIHRMSEVGLSASQAATALELATRDHSGSGLVADLLRVVLAMGGSVSKLAPEVNDFVIPTLRIGAGSNAGGTTIRDCIIQRIEFEEGYSSHGVPKFVRVNIESIEGAAGAQDLPGDRFIDCDFGEFVDSASTTSAILDLHLPDKAKVRLTILKKIYVQRGRGRKESALVRGLDPKLRQLVAPSLMLLQSEGLIMSARSGHQTVWVPVKTSQRRVLQLLASPMSSADSVLSV